MSIFHTPAAKAVQEEAISILETERLALEEFVPHLFVEHVVHHIRAEGELTFLDCALILKHHFGINPYGDLNLYSADGRNIVIWFDCSAEFLLAMRTVMADPRVRMASSSATPYDPGITGVFLSYPPVSDLFSREEHESTHWHPGVFTLAV
ncbi:hypothetical protein [Prescottella agglutinans]|uniref:Uncharacterized protein n=1 Tax=Prescottella agglutinans TaxID=1644129 RepID=A0ABT6MFV6_9NOCA|nr:hypothetical protein [Prescottella agglutinans]MDH6283203.1 hypothetical protein [Prescottella agglutinans]